MKIDDLLRFMVQQEASDLHLKPMRPPLLRLKGKLLPLKSEPLSPEVIQDMLLAILTDRNREKLEQGLAVDFGYSLAGVSRFRASVFHQRGTLSGVFRRVPFDFPTIDEWGLPAVLKETSVLPQGLVLITGPTGSGKSSTLAAIMRLISDSRQVHLVTIEDPIEFLLKDNLAAISQREVGTDTPSFQDALRNTLRQDPDVIMVGEMRDRVTMETVLQAAETGHLVFSTLHTNSATQTIDRILDQFPADQQRQIRQQLASVLQFVISMRLVERADGTGMVAAIEVLRHTPRVQKLIQEGNLDALQEEIEGSVAYHRMQTMNQSLAALVLHQAITRDTALEVSTNPGDLDLLLRKLTYAAEHGEGDDDDMAEPFSDFSKILELQEIRKAYDELEESTRNQLRERDDEIHRLREELNAIADGSTASNGDADHFRSENERLTAQINVIRQEYEAKIERLNARIKDLSGGVGAPGATPARTAEEAKRGFFRR